MLSSIFFQGLQLLKPDELKVGVELGVETTITIAASKEYEWNLPLVTPKQELDVSYGLAPSPFVAKLSFTFRADVILSG